MNVLLVYAHPEPTSLNGSLQRLQPSSACKPPATPVQVSDLYAMNWKATARRRRQPRSAMRTNTRFDAVARLETSRTPKALQAARHRS